MAYTRNWNNATPAGTRAAKEIDDAIREAKVDVFERIATLLEGGHTIDEDPLVLKAGITGKVTDRTISISPHILAPVNDEDDVEHQDGYFQADNDGASARGSIIIPVGYVIKLFEAFLDKNGGVSVTAELFQVNMTSGAVASISTPLTRSAVGIGVVTSAALNYTVLNTDAFTIKVNGNPGAGFRWRAYGFRLTYDRSGGDLSY